MDACVRVGARQPAPIQGNAPIGARRERDFGKIHGCVAQLPRLDYFERAYLYSRWKRLLAELLIYAVPREEILSP